MRAPLKAVQERLFDRVNPLVGFSVSRYVLSIGIFVGVVIFGFLATRSLGVDQLPNINIPIVSVQTSYPGATPELVDKNVTQLVEGAIVGIEGVSGIDSTSNTGSSRVTIQFAEGSDKNANVNKVSAAVAGLRGLPDAAGTPSVRTFDPNAQAILDFGVSGGSAPQEQVYEYVNDILLPSLQQLPGVADVSLTGGAQRQFQVLLNPDRLAQANLSPNQVTSAITGADVNQSIGSITRSGTTVNFTTRSVPGSLNDLSGIVIDGAENLHVGDVAVVKDASAVSSYTRINGKPVVLVSIQQTSGSNAVAVVNAVENQLKATTFPKGYSYTVGNDTTGPVRSAISATTRELILTALVVAVIVLLFLGRVNTAFSVILAIPISLAAAPVLYSLMGFTFNQVSLLAMIVAIGIVVDDSIVVAENVERYRAMGLDRVQAVLRGASEVFSAVAAASLSLLAVLIPVSFVGGFIGGYLQQFALGLAAAVLLSWLEALLFLTVRMAYTPDAPAIGWRALPSRFGRLGFALRWGVLMMRNLWVIIVTIVAALVLWRILGPVWALAALLMPVVLGLLNYLLVALLSLLEALSGTLNGGTEAVLGYVRDGYARSLGSVLTGSAAVLLGAVAFLVVTALLIAPHISFQFTPQSDNGTFTARLRLPRGTSLDAANSYAARLESFLLRQREVKTVEAQISSGNASMNVTLVPLAERQSVFNLITGYQVAVRQLYADNPDVSAFMSAGGGFRGQGSAVSISLVSANLNVLNERVGEAATLLGQSANVLSVQNPLDNTNVQNNFVPDQSRLSATGLSASTVASTLNGYASGSSAGDIEVNGLDYPVQVQIDPSRLQDQDSLLSLPVYSQTLGSNVSVGQLGSFVQAAAPSSISRSDRLYGQTLSVQLGENAPSQTEFQQQVAQQFTQAGILDNQVTLSSGGAFSQQGLSNQLSATGLSVFALGLLLVYLVMGAQFNSFRYPLYLLLPVPFAVAGALWFLFMTGNALDIFSVMGFLLLIGLSAKNAILYLEFVVERLERLSLRDALIESARLRFRPIIMTTLTVLVISLPLILGHGEGSEFNRGIGITMLGGILVSAVMTFFVVPSAFYFFERRRRGEGVPQAERPRPATDLGLSGGAGGGS